MTQAIDPKEVRSLLAGVEDQLTRYHNSIAAHEAHIAQLKRLHTRAVGDALEAINEKDRLTADNNRMMTVIMQANDELKQLRRDNSSMHQRLEAHAEARLHGTKAFKPEDILCAGLLKDELRDKKADRFYEAIQGKSHLTTFNDIAKSFWNDRTTVRPPDDRMANVCRLASAAIRHIEAGRPAIAVQLLKPLAGGQHDTYKEDRSWLDDSLAE